MSRPKANSSRDVAAWMARQQTKMAMHTVTRKVSVTQVGKCASKMYAIAPVPSACVLATSGMARTIDTSQKALMTAVMPIANSMARGTSRVGLIVSSASPPAVSKPYSTQAPVSIEARKMLP